MCSLLLPSTAVSYKQALFLTFPLYCITFWPDIFKSFPFRDLYLFLWKAYKETLFKNKYRTLILQRIYRWFKTSSNNRLHYFYWKQVKSDKLSLLFEIFALPVVTGGLLDELTFPCTEPFSVTSEKLIEFFSCSSVGRNKFDIPYDASRFKVSVPNI